MNCDTIATADPADDDVQVVQRHCRECSAIGRVFRTRILPWQRHTVRCAACDGTGREPVDPAVLALARSLPLATVVDQTLYRRCSAEGFGFANKEEAYDWVFHYAPRSGFWRYHCHCGGRCNACTSARFVVSLDGRIAYQLFDAWIRVPLPPEDASQDLVLHAGNFRGEHAEPQPPWLDLDDSASNASCLV